MKKIFIWAIAALFMTACSKDSLNDGSGNTNGGQEFDGEEAWVSLGLNSKLKSRSLNGTPTDPGTLTESDVKTVRVIFFDGVVNNSNVVYDKVFTVGVDGEIGTPGAMGGKGDAFKVPGTTKSALIIANPISTLKAAYDKDTPGTSFTYAQFNVAKNDAVSVLTDGTNGFMMTNSRGTLEPVAIYTTEAAANSSPNSIHIDRVVSKVRLKAATATSSTANVTVSDVKWVLNVTNKMYFPVAQRTPTFLGSMTPTDALYNLGSYRQDPNYDHASITGMDDVTSTVYKNNYFAYTSNTAPAPGDWKNPGATDTDWIYCHENTQNKAGNVHAYTTQALIRAKYLPTQFYIPGGSTEANPDADGDWLKITTTNPSGTSIQHSFYSQQSLAKWILLELTNKYTDRDPDNFKTNITTSYNNFLAGLQAAGVTGVTEVTIPARDAVTYPDPADQGAAVAALFTAQNTAVKNNGAAMVGNVSYYDNALNYYKVMVKHDNDTNKGNNELGEFGVVRNAQYDITVNRFNNPGYPVVPEPDPKEPDEDDEGWLSVEINVNPWTWYSQEEDL